MLQLRYKTIDKRPLWLVNPKYTLGSDTGCDVYIKDNRLESQHVELNIFGDEAVATNLAGDNLVKINGSTINEPTQLRHGDSLEIGSISFELIDPKQLKNTLTEKSQGGSKHTEWSLRAVNTALAEKQFIIDGTTVVGRSNECDITLGVAHLSRKHAQLSIVRGELVVEDLQSSNGTFVNGNKVHRATLKTGDELSFDTLRFKVSGPERQVDNDPTKVRNFDNYETSIRAAVEIPADDAFISSKPAVVKVQTQARSQSQPQVQARPLRKSPRPVRPTVAAVNPVVTDAEGKAFSNGWLWIIMILLVVGGSAWFFLNKS